MQNIPYQQTPPVNHTQFRCNVGDHFKNCASLAYLHHLSTLVKIGDSAEFVLTVSFCAFLRCSFLCVSCGRKLLLQFICRQISFGVFHTFSRLLLKGRMTLCHDISSLQSVRHAANFQHGSIISRVLTGQVYVSVHRLVCSFDYILFARGRSVI